MIKATAKSNPLGFPVLVLISKETQRFLNTMPKSRFKFVFTPKHGSWLNMMKASLAR
ncbi:hypothetical protein GCWU000282_02316 [Catonella morbi ATCC 51271]|uniref:Tc1-like transposase DDE domain-containing protein n=1 Tax=Catonella morbi ATCC 51271 TaxID=592026 RepID=V2Y284_9FIRM|nr:hypothetical protein GCWU000282_02316 [Catonella morbi ATCC 51271]